MLTHYKPLFEQLRHLEAYSRIENGQDLPDVPRL
jgi:hypothetical protein